MARQKITPLNNTAAVIVPPEMLEQIGLAVGDEVDITIMDRTLIVRPLDEIDRERLVATLTQSLLERRRQLYEALAEGPA